jgi:hypothetical protein
VRIVTGAPPVSSTAIGDQELCSVDTAVTDSGRGARLRRAFGCDQDSRAVVVIARGVVGDCGVSCLRAYLGVAICERSIERTVPSRVRGVTSGSSIDTNCVRQQHDATCDVSLDSVAGVASVFVIPLSGIKGLL